MAYSPQDVYARHLVSRRGYPLWTPEPNMNLPDAYVREGLKIGDVGVVVPEDESGVPNNFTPILLSGRDIAKFPKAEGAGRIISTSSVTRVRNTDESDDSEDPARRAQPGPLNYEFTLSSQEGAVLILPEGAERYYLRNERPFLDEAIQHAVDWYTFAEQRLGRIISHDSLYLITGFYKSRSWSLAAYQRGAGSTGESSAQFKALQVGTGSIETSYTWETTQAMDWRVGPSDQHYNGIPNQTVFIHGFKIAIREGILGTKWVNVKADIPSIRPYHVEYSGGSWFSSLWGGGSGSSSGSASNTSKGLGMSTSLNMDTTKSNLSGAESDGVHEDVTISRFPQLSNLQPFHPSDLINQYLLRKVPSASIAITHDGQWTGLLERGLLKPEELFQEDCLITLISSNCTLAFCEGAVYLESTTMDSPFDNDIAITTSMSSKQRSGVTPYTPPGLWPLAGEFPARFLVASQPVMDGPLPGGSHVSSDHTSTNCNSSTIVSAFAGGQAIPASSHPEHVVEWYLTWQKAVIINGPRVFVPQTIYEPHSQGDKERYVSLAKLHPPITFISQDSPEWGIPMSHLLSKQSTRLLGGEEPVFVSCGPSIGIRVQWPGYQPCHKQISTRDYTSNRRMINKERLAKVVARCVKRFMETMSEQAMEVGSDRRWRVGPLDIRVDDVILVSLHHVSQGSWQPQLRLCGSIRAGVGSRSQSHQGITSANEEISSGRVMGVEIETSFSPDFSVPQPSRRRSMRTRVSSGPQSHQGTTGSNEVISNNASGAGVMNVEIEMLSSPDFSIPPPPTMMTHQWDGQLRLAGSR